MHKPEEAFHGGVERPEGRIERGAGLRRLAHAHNAVAVLDRQLPLLGLRELGEVVLTVREQLVDVDIVISLRKKRKRGHGRREGGGHFRQAFAARLPAFLP